MKTITYANGQASQTAETLTAAKEIILAAHPEAYIESFDDRALCWESEDESQNDDGAKAFAAID